MKTRMSACAACSAREKKSEPVGAWPDPPRVRVRRWIGRHRMLVSGLAAAGAVAVVGLAGAAGLPAAKKRAVAAAPERVCGRSAEFPRHAVGTGLVNRLCQWLCVYRHDRITADHNRGWMMIEDGPGLGPSRLQSCFSGITLDEGLLIHGRDDDLEIGPDLRK